LFAWVSVFGKRNLYPNILHQLYAYLRNQIILKRKIQVQKTMSISEILQAILILPFGLHSL
jgi:hypothetical protein